MTASLHPARVLVSTLAPTLAAILAVLLAGCAPGPAPVPSEGGAAAVPPALARPLPTPRAAAPDRGWDEGRIAALLAAHARVQGYRTVCWDRPVHRLVRCYDI